MKKTLLFLFAVILFCSGSLTSSAAEVEKSEKIQERKNILVVYFSCTGTTKEIAEHIHQMLHSDIYRIEPVELYTSEDLNYNLSTSRANREQNDVGARPAIVGTIDNIEQYDSIFLGYPIWWGRAPKIISTFLESYDFSGKTIVPFCTSGGSGIDGSEAELHTLAQSAKWLDGRRFSGGSSEEAVKSWLDTIELPELTSDAVPEIYFENEVVTVDNVPENATLIFAFYQKGVLIHVETKKGNGTISENISDQALDADMMKAFLWDMTSIRPLCNGIAVQRKKSTPMQIKVVSGTYEVVYELNDSRAAKELYAQLPLSLEVENYGRNEKIFYPPEKLDTADTPLAAAGKGTLAYYAPWGDVVMFYDHYEAGNGLFALGKVISGEENIEKLNGTVTITVY